MREVGMKWELSQAIYATIRVRRGLLYRDWSQIMDRRSGPQAYQSPQATRNNFASLEWFIGREKRIAHIEQLICDGHRGRQGNFTIFPLCAQDFKRCKREAQPTYFLC
jgi:hypothetical protein